MSSKQIYYKPVENAPKAFLLGDYIMMGVFGLSLIIGFTLLVVNDDILMHDAGIWTILLTHALVVPSILLVMDTGWLAGILVISTCVSLLWHFSQQKLIIDYYPDLKTLDISIQTTLVVVLCLIFVYKDFPTWGVGLCALVAGLTGVFAQDTIVGNLEVYIFIDTMAFISIFLFMIYKIVVNKWDKKEHHFNSTRPWQFILAILISMSASFVCYLVASNASDNSYELIHSLWHVCAYTAIYFTLRSRAGVERLQPRVIRIQRTDFAIQQ